MGTYVWYSGAADYPLEKRKRIKENILKMLDAGGMMQIESVKNNNHMLLFYSLDSRGYEGFMNGSESIAEGIVNSGKVKDFENFMRENGIEYNIGISGWNKHHLFLSMSLTHFIILSFLSQCKKDLEKFQGYRYLLQRTIQI